MKDVSAIEQAASLDLRPRNGFFTSDMSINEARILALSQSLLKKYAFVHGTSCKVRSEKAITLWKEMNERCRQSFKVPNGLSYIDDVLLDLQESIRSDLDNWDGPAVTLQNAVQFGITGPGKASGVQNNDFHWKMGVGELTNANPKLYEYYKVYTDSRWRSMECERVSQSGLPRFAKSKLFTVPKDSSIDRVALQEPSLEMFFQKGIEELLKRVLWSKHHIDLSTQPNLNRKMACIGSSNGRFATIDLKSASDTISLKFARWLLGDKLIKPFQEARSSHCDQGPLYMLSSMGNAFTFPLQTLIFANVAKVSLKSLGLPLWQADGLPSYSVFGDDIIVDGRAFRRVCQLLERCGFIVNQTKSFNEGPFRESCGGDYFKGHDTRGVYLKKDLRQHANSYAAFNRLVRWSVRYGIAIPNILECIFRSAPFRPVPFDTGDTAGHHWPRGLLRNIKHAEGLDFYRALRPRQSFRRVVNALPNGLMLSILGGFAVPCRETENNSVGQSQVKVGVRQLDPSYYVSRESTPSWDWIPRAGLTIRDYTHVVSLVS